MLEPSLRGILEINLMNRICLPCHMYCFRSKEWFKKKKKDLKKGFLMVYGNANIASLQRAHSGCLLSK